MSATPDVDILGHDIAQLGAPDLEHGLIHPTTLSQGNSSQAGSTSPDHFESSFWNSVPLFCFSQKNKYILKADWSRERIGSTYLADEDAGNLGQCDYQHAIRAWAVSCQLEVT